MNVNRSYVGARRDIAACVPANATRLLDIGCSVGTFGDSIKQSHPLMHITGLEVDPVAADIARNVLDEVFVADIDSFSLVDGLPSGKFDCIVMADVLEHLKDPWRVVDEVQRIAADGATIIICVPNVRHFDTIINLVFRGRWPYRDRGIHDRTHLRFFTRRNLVEMVASDKLTLVKLKANYRILERPGSINRWARFIALPILREFLAFQYIAVLRKHDGHAVRQSSL